MSIKPKNHTAIKGLGRVALEMQDFPTAKKIFESACRLHPQDPFDWYHCIIATKVVDGDEATLEKLRQAIQNGVSLGRWFGKDWSSWKHVSPPLRQAIEKEIKKTKNSLK